jgi:hypothetical protein
MKKAITILLLSFLAVLSFAQDVPILNQHGPVYQLGSQVAWGSAGVGGFNANYIITIPNADENVCVQVSNLNPSSAHLFNFYAYGTVDPNVTGFLNQTSPQSAPWTSLLVDVFQANLSPGASGYTALNFGSLSVPGQPVFFVQSRGSARVALVFLNGTPGSGTPDTANVTATLTQASSCGAVQPGDVGLYQTGVTATTRWTIYGVLPPGTQANTAFFPSYDNASRFSSCVFNAIITNVSGTTPTLNLYVQDYDYLTNTQNDRVSFVQATTGTSTQQAAILAGLGTSNPAAVKNGALAAGSVTPGRFAPVLQLYAVPGGTSPNYTIYFSGHCF